MPDIERLIVDYFEACGGFIVEYQDGEWFVFCGRYGSGVSLTGLAIEIMRQQQKSTQPTRKYTRTGNEPRRADEPDHNWMI